MMKNVLPNAIRFEFTGTPVFRFYSVMSEEVVREVENKILNKLLKINGVKVFID